MPAAANQFLPFATGAGANVLSPAAFAALTSLVANGFSSGVAPSQQLNTVWRQASFVSAALAQVVANTGVAANDDGDFAGFVAKLTAAIAPAAVPGLGEGQTWQVVSRVSGATNYNMTGRPIIASAYTPSSTSNAVSITVGGVVVAFNQFSVTGAIGQTTAQALIPPGASYIYTIAGSATFVELR